MMKNVMIVDGAENCAFDVFSWPEDLFVFVFKQLGQNIAFAENIDWNDDILTKYAQAIWSRPVVKSEVKGIHGTLFYGLKATKEKYYPNLRDSDLDGTGRSWIHPS